MADRAARTITVVNPADGRELPSVSTGAAPDYVRYSSSTGEVLVAELEGSPSGIEVFAVEGPAPALRHVPFIPVPEGPEGLTVSAPVPVQHVPATLQPAQRSPGAPHVIVLPLRMEHGYDYVRRVRTGPWSDEDLDDFPLGPAPGQRERAPLR
ncbi:MAG TPA: hypothetical protein VGV93_00200 [Acidimicrobiales bacterium]|nr:hypothetical protein [Acidimicrobiales bacterium]